MSGRSSTAAAAVFLVAAIAVFAFLAVRSGQRRAASPLATPRSSQIGPDSVPSIGGSVPIRCEDALGCKPGEERTLKVEYRPPPAEGPVRMIVMPVDGEPLVIASIDGMRFDGKPMEIKGAAGEYHMMTIVIDQEAPPGTKAMFQLLDGIGEFHGAELRVSTEQ